MIDPNSPTWTTLKHAVEQRRALAQKTITERGVDERTADHERGVLEALDLILSMPAKQRERRPASSSPIGDTIAY